MAGYNRDPRVRLGLIALLAARRVKAETISRNKVTPAETPKEVAAAAAKAKTRKSGWFR